MNYRFMNNIKDEEKLRRDVVKHPELKEGSRSVNFDRTAK